MMEIPILVPISYPDEAPAARARKPVSQLVTVI